MRKEVVALIVLMSSVSVYSSEKDKVMDYLDKDKHNNITSVAIGTDYVNTVDRLLKCGEKYLEINKKEEVEYNKDEKLGYYNNLKNYNNCVDSVDYIKLERKSNKDKNKSKLEKCLEKELLGVEAVGLRGEIEVEGNGYELFKLRQLNTPQEYKEIGDKKLKLFVKIERFVRNSCNK